MAMKGGGHFGVGPGQVTDDSEMALSLMTGIIEANSAIVAANETAKSTLPPEEFEAVLEKSSHKCRLDREYVAQSYLNWYKSRPFDMGNNTKATIGAMAAKGVKPPLLPIALAGGARSTKSASNGAMMRLSPLIVWCSQLSSVHEIMGIIRADVAFTHSMPLTQQACEIYAVALVLLI